MSDLLITNQVQVSLCVWMGFGDIYSSLTHFTSFFYFLSLFFGYKLRVEGIIEFFGLIINKKAQRALGRSPRKRSKVTVELFTEDY